MEATATRQQVDVMAEAMAAQITALRDENKELEERLQARLTAMEKVSSEREDALRKLRQAEKQFENSDRENNDLKARVTDAEANSSAVEARNVKLSEQLDESLAQVRELKQKNSSITEELKLKASQLENRFSTIDEGNKAMLAEKSQRVQAEGELKALRAKYREAKSQIQRLTSANQALQDIVAERDHSLTNLKVYLMYTCCFCLSSNINYSFTNEFHPVMLLYSLLVGCI